MLDGMAGRLRWSRSSRMMLSSAYRWLRMVSLTKDLPTRCGAYKRVKASGVSHLAATGMFAHQGLEAQGFLHDPVGFFAGRWRRAVISSRIWSRASRKALALLPGEAFGQTGQSEERWCHEQGRDQHEEQNEHGQKVLDYEVRRSGSINMLPPSWRKYGKVIPPTTLKR